MAEGTAPGAVQSADRLASLVLLQKKIRDAAHAEEIGFLLVNDARLLVPYRNAVLWRDTGARLGHVDAVTGIPVPAQDAPFVRFMGRLGAALAKSGAAAAPVDRAALPAEIAAEWGEFLAPHAAWLPLRGRSGRVRGLVVARDEPLREGDVALLAHLADTAAHALDGLERGRVRWPLPGLGRARRAWLIGAAAAVVLLMALPVRLSVLAPAEVTPRDPLIVRAPLAGVIAAVEVAPNQPVAKGQILLRLDDRELKSRLDVSRQTAEIAQAELAQAQQSAIISREAQAAVPILQQRLDLRRREVAYAEELLKRVTVAADEPGIAIYPDQASLKGRPVRLGERIMVVADPKRVELEAWVPVGDSVRLPQGSAVAFFLNTDPDRPLDATLDTVNYQASLSPEGVMGFRAIAQVTDGGEPPRIGLRGTAKLYGERASLFYYVFRRPLAWLRRAVGI